MMKFLAFILALQLSVVSIEPTLLQAFTSVRYGKSCCDNSCHNSTNKSKPFTCPVNCPNNGSCKVCFNYAQAFTASPTLRFKLFIPQASGPVAAIEHLLISDHIADCFHPPELV